MKRTEAVRVETNVISSDRADQYIMAITRWPDVSTIFVYGEKSYDLATYNLDKTLAALGYVRAATPARRKGKKAKGGKRA